MLQRARVADEVAMVGAAGAAGPGVSVAEVDSVPAHCPLVHTSLIVAALPSSQLVPSGAAVSEEQTPSAHVPASWQALDAAPHTTPTHGSGVPAHDPDRHISFSVVSTPSSQLTPSESSGAHGSAFDMLSTNDSATLTVPC